MVAKYTPYVGCGLYNAALIFHMFVLTRIRFPAVYLWPCSVLTVASAMSWFLERKPIIMEDRQSHHKSHKVKAFISKQI